MRTWCLVEHLVSGRVSLAEYDPFHGDLQVDGQPVRRDDYWCVEELANVLENGDDPGVSF